MGTYRKKQSFLLFLLFIASLLYLYLKAVDVFVPTAPSQIVNRPENYSTFPRALIKAPTLPVDGVPTKYSRIEDAAEGVRAAAAAGQEGDNTARVSEEELRRWRDTRIMPLATANLLPRHSIPDFEHRLWALLAPWLQLNETYPDPVAIDFGGSPAALFYATAHPKAGVVSLSEATDSFTPATLSNFLRLRLPSPPEAYEPLFRSCHLFNSAFLLGERWERLQGRGLVSKVAKLARILYLELPSGVNPSVLVGGTPVSSYPIIQTRSDRFLHRVTVLSVERTCRKTWTAPEVQWGRLTTLSYFANTGVVTFRVASTTPTKKNLGRVIHPISFVPHINLETLSAIGLSEQQKKVLFARQVATPRYPDPMVHNWIWAGGGELRRIDKVDLRYEKDVNETATYWGVDTLGYLNLLADNLCMELLPSGFPVIASRPPCSTACGCCAAACSYAPLCQPRVVGCVWDQPVCSACIECSKCLLSSPATESSAPLTQCPFNKYTSWSKAAKLWKKWEKRANSKRNEDWYPSDPGICRDLKQRR